MVRQSLHHYPCHCDDDDDGSFNVPYPFLIHTPAAPVIGHHEFTSLAAQFDPLTIKNSSPRQQQQQKHHNMRQLIPNSFSSSTQAVLLEKRDIQHEHNQKKNNTTTRRDQLNLLDNDNDVDQIMKLNLLLYPSHTAVASIDDSSLNDSNDNYDNSNENGTSNKYNIFSPRKMIMNTNFYESMYPEPVAAEQQQQQSFMKHILFKKKHHRRSHSLPSVNDYNQLCNNNFNDDQLTAIASSDISPTGGGGGGGGGGGKGVGGLLTKKPNCISSRSKSNPMNIIHLPWSRRNSSNNNPTPLSLQPQETLQQDDDQDQVTSHQNNAKYSPTTSTTTSSMNNHTKYAVLDDPIETIRINHNNSNHRRSSISIFQRKARSDSSSTKIKKSTKGKKYQLFTPTFDDMKDKALQQTSFLDDDRNDTAGTRQEQPIFLSSSLLLSSIYHPLHQPTKKDETTYSGTKTTKKVTVTTKATATKKATTTTMTKPTKTTVSNFVHQHKPNATSFFTTTGYYNEWTKERSSEQNASEWQLNIPDYNDITISTKLCQFIEYCHSGIECYFDLYTLIQCNRLELLQFVRGDHPHPMCKTIHIPVHYRNHVEYLLDCSNDITNVCGYYRSYPQENDNDNNSNDNENVIDMGECIIDPDNYREVLILERNRQFICILRGTSDEQCGMKAYSKLNKHRQPATMTIHSNFDPTTNNNNATTTVYRDPYVAYQGLQSQMFTLLDELTEANPFYDVTFIGHSFASTIATLAGYQYAISHPTIRVSVYGTQTMNWKVGLLDFRMAVHSIPNLRIIRLEHHHDSIHQSINNHHNNSISHHQSQSGGYRVGHLIRMVPPSSTSVRIVNHKEQQLSVLTTSTIDDDKQFAYAYKFGYGNPMTNKAQQQQQHQNQHPIITTSKTTSTKTTSATSSMMSSIISKCRTTGVAEKNVDEYVDTLEALGSLHWVTTFVNDNVGGSGRRHHTSTGYDNTEHRELA